MTTPRFVIPETFIADRPIRVTVVGAGGTGSLFLSELGRLDAALRVQGHHGMDVTVFDPDTFSPANFGRQMTTQGDAGFNKAIMVVGRVNNFFGLDWRAVPEALDPVRRGIGADLIVGCVDSGKFRYQLGQSCRGVRTDALWCDFGNGSDRGQIVLGHLGTPSRGQRLPNVYDLYGQELLAGDDDDLPSCSLAEALTRQKWAINQNMATAGATLLSTLLFDGGLDAHGALVRLNPLTVSPLMIDPAVWATFGYTATTPDA
ncbi:PRTRC system ThiF family protein [Rhodanobacter sp. FW106-PBR-LB-2-11]|uniref:PRTRC system ThiF family protein n=1 Tax=Rhodanobacter sp. FW106-PBR-LB-2-11 TaxID=1524463 RepID=UPI0034E50CEA